MPTTAVLRVLAILVVAATFAAARRSPAWLGIVVTVGLAHYLVGMLYSRRQILDVASSRRNWIRLIGLALAGAALYLTNFPLLVYFGVHHAFNETYLLDRATPPDAARQLRWWRASGLVLHLTLYAFLVRQSLHITYDQRPVLFVGLALGLMAAYATFFAWLYRLRGSLSTSQLVDNCSIELVAAGLVAASFFVRINYLQVVLYHFVFWALYPAVGLWRRGTASLARYVGVTAFVMAALLVVGAVAVRHDPAAAEVLWGQFLLWSYVHITLSLAVSAANPAWIRRLFGSRPAPAPGALGAPAEA